MTDTPAARGAAGRDEEPRERRGVPHDASLRRPARVCRECGAPLNTYNPRITVCDDCLRRIIARWWIDE